MTTCTQAVSRASIVVRTSVALVIACAGFIAGTLLPSPKWSSDASAALAQPALAAEPSFLKASPSTGVIAPADAYRSGRPDGEQFFEPRECDLAKGIATACLFMD